MKNKPCIKCRSNNLEVETVLYTRLPGQVPITDQQVHINKLSDLVGTTASGVALGFGQNPEKFFNKTTGIGLVKRFITCKECGNREEIEIDN